MTGTTELSNTLSSSFSASFQDFGKRVNHLSTQLDQQQFWIKPYSYGNSFGHLVLHLTGNLNYFIGAQIANTGYKRNRELEFNDPNHYPKEEVLQRLDEAIAMVINTIEQQDVSSWSSSYEAEWLPEIQDKFSIFLTAAAHFHHHLGQMIYIVRAFSDQEQP